MAKGKKTGGRDFVKGICPNPLGRPRTPPELKAMRRLTNDQLQDIGSIIIKGNKEALQNVLKDPDASVLQLWIARMAEKGIRSGHEGPLNMILNRLVGRVTENLNVTLPKPTVINARNKDAAVILGAVRHREGEDDSNEDEAE